WTMKDFYSLACPRTDVLSQAIKHFFLAGTPSEWVDCIQASDMCNQNPHCSSRYRVMRQCLVGKEKEAMLDNNQECRAALRVLLVSPLFDCRCKRGMKKEMQCLQNYWTIHMGLNEDMEDSSPYEPVAPGRHQDAFLAPKGFHCADAEKTCNPCLDAAKACNLNGTCKRHRSSYIATCSKEDPNKGETCSKKRCHKALRLFLDPRHRQAGTRIEPYTPVLRGQRAHHSPPCRPLPDIPKQICDLLY
uniref:GDNF family receptor alpha 2a n=1 Tax=Hippocampus comes TaxID=109280 RepID=A0A3Q3E5M1_HIPCM